MQYFILKMLTTRKNKSNGIYVQKEMEWKLIYEVFLLHFCNLLKLWKVAFVFDILF